MIMRAHDEAIKLRGLAQYLERKEPRFVRGDNPENETCLACGKHVRNHFGGTEKRCFAREGNDQ